MNKVILKQKKKEKKKEKEIVITKLIIRNKLLNHFSNHIGEENKTNREEVFQVITGIHSNMVNGYMRFYWWSIIEKEIKRLRREDKCFVIKKGGNYFVLKEQEEADYFKEVCDKAIKGMGNAQTRADEWVEKEKWRNIEKEDTEEEEKPEEKIDKILDKAKTKVVRLWKGEK